MDAVQPALLTGMMIETVVTFMLSRS